MAQRITQLTQLTKLSRSPPARASAVAGTSPLRALPSTGGARIAGNAALHQPQMALQRAKRALCRYPVACSATPLATVTYSFDENPTESVVTERRIDLDGRITLNIREAGGDGPLVVMVHGFPESSYSWRHQLPALAAAGYKAVAYDQRGFGESDCPAEEEAYNILELVEDCKALIKALGYEKAVVVGHDWGSPIAWHMCVLNPDMVTAVASLSVPFTPRVDVKPSVKMMEKYGEDFYVFKMQKVGGFEVDWMKDVRATAHMFFVGPETIGMKPEEVELPAWCSEEDINQWVASYEKSGFLGGLNYYRNSDRNWELTEDLVPKETKVTHPALMLMGDNELPFLKSGVPAMEPFVPNLTYKEISNAGHWVQQEQPEQVNQELLQFIEVQAPVNRA